MTLQKLRDKVVRPQDLCFTQESICVTFQKPRNQERIDDAVDLIIQRKLSPKAFPKMNVVQFQDRLWSLDNRRLWVFKKAEVEFITVTLVSVDFQGRFSTLPSTSPYLYASLSNPDFFPRIRGHCKEIFTDDDPDRRPSLSPPSTPHVRVRPGDIPNKIYKQTTPLSVPRSVPRPKLSSKHQNFPPPSKVAPQSKYSNYYAHHHEPLEYDNHGHERFDYDKRHREAFEYDHHYYGPGHLRKEHSDYPHLSRIRDTGTPPIPRKDGADGLSRPKSNKRYYEDARHCSRIPHEDFSHHTRRPDEAMRRHPSRPIYAAVGHTSKTRETIRRTHNEAISPPAKKPRAPSQAREFEASSRVPKPRVPAPPEDRRARSPPREVRASSPTRKANLPPYPVRKPGKRTRSSERNSSSPGNLPPYRPTEPKASGKYRHENLPPLPVDKFASRGEDAKSSKSRAAAPPLPAPKRSKTSKPSSNPRPFSYGFHSHPKRSKASRSSKKTVSLPGSNPPSTQLNDDPGDRSMPSSTSAEDRSPPPKIPGAPLPSPSTTAPLPTTQTREKDDCSISDLPIPAVSASRSPSLTCCPNEKHCHQSGDEFHSSIIGTILGTDPPENHRHQWKCGISRTTKTRQQSPGLANCPPEIELMLSETEENLFKLDKQSTVDPKLHLPPTPSEELNTKADLAEVLNCVEEINRSLQSPQTTPTVENLSKKQTEAESPDNSPTRTPIEGVDLTQQPDNGPNELKDVSGQEDFQESIQVAADSIVECPVQYDSSVESTLKDIRPLKAPSTAYYGDSDVRRAPGNVDVTVTACMEPPKPQLSTPSKTKEVWEARFAAKAVNVSDHLHVPNQGKYWRSGYQEMARTAINEITVKLDISTQACQTTGNEIPDASQRITRGQVRERERRERREKRKKREAEKKKEREAEKKKEREAEKKKEREAEEKKEREAEKKKEREAEEKKEREAEKKKEREAEKEKEREAEKTRERESEKKKEREAEEKKKREAEEKKEREAEKKKEREAEKIREREAEKRKERETEKRKEREAEKRKEREAEKTTEREAEKKKAREAEKKKAREVEKKKAREEEKRKEREAEKRKEREAEKRKEREAEEKKEREAEKKKEKETRALLEKKTRSASTNIGKEIVPYDAARSRKASSSGKKVLSGDMVYVKVIGQITESGEEQKRTGSSGRLHPYLRIIGPFRVNRMCNKYSAVLELPDDCDLRPIFCLTVLKKSRCPLDNDLPNKRLTVELKPEAILNKRVARRLRKRRVFHYLVKWKSLPATEATWEPESVFDEHPSLLDQTNSPLYANPYMLRNWRA